MALDEATVAFLEQMAAAGGPPLEEMTPAEARGLGPVLREMSGPGPAVAAVSEHAIPVADGTAIAGRLLVPEGAVGGLVVYLHGGGWVMGSVDDADVVGRELATRARVAVLLVEYRLAPEHPHPTAAEDAWAALRWAAEHVEALVGAPVPLVVAGDSAGGNLAAVAAQRAREAGLELALQVLVYPIIAADFDTATYTDPANEAVLTRAGMMWFWDHYVADVGSRALPSASPAAEGDLAGLAPAVVVLAEHDVLRQEGEDYAARLSAAGVPVDLRIFAGQMHMFFTLVNLLPGSEAGLQHVAGRISATLGTGPAS